jgi:hypothetical protein
VVGHRRTAELTRIGANAASVLSERAPGTRPGVVSEPFTWLTTNRLSYLCARCGDPIGAYEALWLELADGTLRASSYLNLGGYPRPKESRLWHLGCLAPGAAPPGAEM